MTLPSGVYALPLLVSGDHTLPCNSGYEGSLTFACNADFTWSLPQDTCGAVSPLLSRAEQVGCPAATIDGIPVDSAIFGETIEVPCPAGRHEGMMNVTCSATGVWETPATLCRASPRES